MHISEGVLSLPVLATGYLCSAVGVGIGLKKLKEEDMVRTAIFSSAFFVASLIHVPFGPASVHLILNGLVGILLGWPCFCAIFIALLLQAVLFQFGGITTLGINTLNMALPALICYFVFSRIIRKGILPGMITGFLCGFISVFLSTLCLSASLVFSGEQFISSAKLIFIAHTPVMIIDGIITGLVLQFIRKVKPEILKI
ncbi:cobalt transporter CbiM [Candidatus Omnitrophota bacterium]